MDVYEYIMRVGLQVPLAFVLMANTSGQVLGLILVKSEFQTTLLLVHCQI